jgi:hypothetical protein
MRSPGPHRSTSRRSRSCFCVYVLRRSTLKTVGRRRSPHTGSYRISAATGWLLFVVIGFSIGCGCFDAAEPAPSGSAAHGYSVVLGAGAPANRRCARVVPREVSLQEPRGDAPPRGLRGRPPGFPFCRQSCKDRFASSLLHHHRRRGVFDIYNHMRRKACQGKLSALWITSVVRGHRLFSAVEPTKSGGS